MYTKAIFSDSKSATAAAAAAAHTDVIDYLLLTRAKSSSYVHSSK